MKKYAALRILLLALTASSLLTLLASLGVLKKIDWDASDALYQSRSASDGEIVLIGLDDRALDELGPYSRWGRDIIARTLNLLNESENCRPAVIGIDVLYSGASDPEQDQMLVDAVGKYGNVVIACAAQFGNSMVEDGNGGYYMDRMAITAFDEPFVQLQEVSELGHINNMLDVDGIIRHHLLYLNMPDGSQIPSMALKIAQRYREYIGGEEISLPPTDSRGFWYLPFSGEAGDYSESISVVDILSGEISADYFADRIVLIGPYAAGLQDSYPTSIDHAIAMYGVECQANAIQALLWGDYKREVSDSLQLAVLFFLLVISFYGFRQPSIKFSTLFWLGSCGAWVLLCKLMYARGWILHVLWVPVGITILYAGWLAINYVLAAMDRRRVTNTFSRYVDPSVINELLKEGSGSLGLGGSLVDIAVLFVDIRGFTTMSEVLTPPQVVEILNQYLTLTTKSIMDNHGTLDKFVGDCTMAFWNAPLPQEDYVMNACKAAMDMVHGSKPLADKLQKEFGRTVSFGIGVNMGPAVVGNIGAPMRMDYTAIGDTVNTAARLEANAPGGTVYISRSVADALEGRIKVTPLETPIRLKGKAEGFEILTLDEICE